MTEYVIESPSGARYSETGTPRGVVVFPTEHDAERVLTWLREVTPSKDQPLRIRPI